MSWKRKFLFSHIKQNWIKIVFWKVNGGMETTNLIIKARQSINEKNLIKYCDMNISMCINRDTNDIYKSKYLTSSTYHSFMSTKKLNFKIFLK